MRLRSKPRLRLRTVFLLLLAALLVVRLALPFALRAYVERTLDRSEDFEAEIGDVDVALWRGAYAVEGLKLLKEGRSRALEPFLDVARLDLALHWGALLRGKLVGSVVLHRPALRIVDADGERRSQTGADTSWARRLQDLFPFYIDRFAVRDGEVRYADATGDARTEWYLSDLYMELRNLTNIRETERVLPAEGEAAAWAQGTGELEAAFVFDPLAEQPRMELDAELRRLPLVTLNDYLQDYAGVDAESGTLSLYTEMVAADGSFDGYVKTLLEGVELVRLGEIDDPGEALEALWEGFVAIAGEVLENQPHDRLATRIPLEGEFGDVGTDPWSIVASLLRNAFVEALRPRLEDSLDLAHGDVGEQGR